MKNLNYKKDKIINPSLPSLTKGRRIAFTLAEVLITLGIIGVVATITLPTLIQNQQKRSLEVATQKFYSTMSQAIKQYMADEGVDDLRDSSLTDGLRFGEEEDNEAEIEAKNDEFFKKYLKAQICEDGCFADRYKTQDGKSSIMLDKPEQICEGRYVMSDGMVVGKCSYKTFGYKDYPGELYVDVNGRKGPNKIGYDLWSMSIFYDGTLDEGGLTPECRKNNKCMSSNAQEERDYRFQQVCKDGGQYGGCFGHFLENGFKFDY